MRIQALFRPGLRREILRRSAATHAVATIWVTIALVGSGSPTIGQASGTGDSALVQAAQKGRLGERFRAYSRIKPGMRAPGISASEWYNTNQAFETGKGAILLDFWSMSCRRCVDHMAVVHDIAHRYRSLLAVVSVHPATNGETMKRFLASRGVTLPVAIDTGATRKLYGVTGVPTYFLVDGSGVVLLKTHFPPKDSQLRTALGLSPTGSQSPLAEIAKKSVLDRRSIVIAPTKAGDSFRPIEASRWFNSPPLDPENLRGRVLLIDFWATWCLPCLDKLPVLQAYADQFGAALTVIGVHYAGDEAPVERFLKERGIRFPVALDTGETWEKYSVNYGPSYLLVDTGGVIRFTGKSPPSIHEITLLLPR